MKTNKEKNKDDKKRDINLNEEAILNKKINAVKDEWQIELKQQNGVGFIADRPDSTGKRPFLNSK